MIRPTPLLALLLAACAPHRSADFPRPTPPAPVDFHRQTPPASAENDRATPVEPATPPAPTFSPRHLRTTLSGISLEALAFDSRTHRLIVADQPGGPSSRWPDARAAARALGGLAAINGGFFTPAGEPLGLLTASGTSTGSLNRASSLGAGFYIEKNARPALIRREKFRGGDHALQSGPFLIENGRPVPGLSPKTSSARSFIATDGSHRWLLARTGPCSLAELALALHGTAPAGIPIEAALNLDGGRSSEIWTSAAIPGGPSHTRPLWNKPVRNFLVLKSRK